LTAQNPFRKLDAHNISSFFVLIEEISHFHLIANRASSQKNVSLLELEWQGEMDKVLLSAKVLLEQTGRANFHQLVQLTCVHSETISQDTRLYDEASHYAAAYWYRMLQQMHNLNEKGRLLFALNACRDVYNRHWTEKISKIYRDEA
jgi:hypothetical protein